MNTSPEEYVIDVSFAGVFRDMVSKCIAPPVSMETRGLIRSFEDKKWKEATYNINDLWEKDENGEWGRSLGTISGGIRGVSVASHQTKVWKLVWVSRPLHKRESHTHR